MNTTTKGSRLKGNFGPISPEGEAWRKHYEELTAWTSDHLVNRTDIFGRYHGDGTQFTAKSELTRDILRRHFRPISPGNIVGLPTTAATEIAGPDGERIVVCTSRWCTNDIDHHGDGMAPDFHFRAALIWHQRAIELGFRPLLVDSDGHGGFRNFLLFREGIPTPLAYHLIRWLQRDWEGLGFAAEPEAFPKQRGIRLREAPGDFRGACGNWVRLFGHHHKREHYTRFWDGLGWLAGEAAVAYLLDHGGDDPALIPDEVHGLVLTREAKGRAGPAPDREGEGTTFTELALVARALAHIRARAGPYDSWIETGQALTPLGDAGLVLWDAWSKTALDKYEPGACAAKWRTFSPDGVGLGSIFRWAKEAGWKYPRESDPIESLGESSRAATPRNGRPGPIEPQASAPAKPLVVRADEVIEKDITWLCEGVIPCGFLTIFYGRTSVGKTFVALDFAARYTTGKAWFDGDERPEPGTVVIFSEDPHSTLLRPRLRALGADLTRVFFVTWDAMKAYDITNTAMLDQILKETGSKPGLVIIDPPTNFLGRVDENSNAQVRRALMHLVEWVDRRDDPTAVVMLTQVNKGGRDLEALERAIGSVAWVATHRIAHCFAPDPKVKGGGFFSCAKSNLGPLPPTRKYVIEPVGKQAKVVWGDQSEATADQVMAAPAQQSADEKAAEWLTERFREKSKWLSDDLKAQAVAAEISLKRLFNAPEDSKVRNLPIRKRQEWDDAHYEKRWTWEAIPPWPIP